MTSDAPIPAMVLSAHVAAMGGIRCLQVAGIPVISAHYADVDFAHRSRHVTDRLRVPHPEHDEDGFVDTLVSAARRFGPTLLVPANDATLGVVSRHKAVLSEHHTVAAADWSVLERIIDKRHTYELAHSIGVPAPRTATPTSRADAERIAAEVTYPCLVKPRVSHHYVQRFGRKLARVHDAAELLAEYDQTAAAGIEVMIQEFIPGDDRHASIFDSYRADGRSIEFTSQKVRLGPPEFGLARVCVSRPMPELSDPAGRFLDALGYTGYSCTEFKRDPRDGIVKLIEVNGRVNRSILHPLAAGLNYPALMYQHLVRGGPLDARAVTRKPVYWIDLASDLRWAAHDLRTRDQSVRDLVRPYLGPAVFAVGDGWDLGPFVDRSAATIRNRTRRLVRRLRRMPASRRPPASLADGPVADA